MSVSYAPSGTAASVGRTYSGYSYDDPGSTAYAEQNPDRIDAKYFLEPVQSNLIGLWEAGGGLAAEQYSNKVWTCLAALNVGDPVYVSTDDTATLALAAAVGTSRVIGFVAEKPTTTTCYLSHFYKGTGSLLTANGTMYLQDDGSYGQTPGTVTVPLGVAISADEYLLSALPIEGISGYSGFSGASGHSGTSGYSGKSGTSGTSGFSGLEGTSGTSGTSGFSGTYSGASGFSGNSGYSGFSGTYSGYSGFSGPSGDSGFSGASPTVNYLAVAAAVKTASETRNSTVLTADSDLKLTLGVGRYHVRGRLLMNGYYASAGGWEQKFTWTYTGTISDSKFMGTARSAGDATSTYGGGSSQQAYSGTLTIYACQNSQYGMITFIEGYVQTTVGGLLTLSWAPYAASNLTMYEGSMIEAVLDGSGAISGTSGYSGAGASGTSGYSGPSGASGFSGAFSGLSGFSGQSALSGASGTSGWSGTSGTSGFSGLSGTSGYSSPSGASGSSGYSGRSGAQGESGLSGASGRSGYSGLTGDSGHSGTSGFSGAEGSAGDSGTSGTSGKSGTSGYSGLGLSGNSGWSGGSGKSGTSGYSGTIGLSGTSGFSALSGHSGLSGRSGTSGYSGQSSASGISGLSGTSGFSGEVGVSGTSGTSGFSGTYSGYSGQSGFSGVGDSGYSGYSGVSGTWGGSDTISYVVDGGLYPVEAGPKGTLWFSYPFRINAVRILCDQSGDLDLDLWSCTYASFPPTATNSISGATAPSFSATNKYQDASLLGWTKTFAAGTGLVVYVGECSAITRFTLALEITRL